jgi:hypothetical protein
MSWASKSPSPPLFDLYIYVDWVLTRNRKARPQTTSPAAQASSRRASGATPRASTSRVPSGRRWCPRLWSETWAG